MNYLVNCTMFLKIMIIENLKRLYLQNIWHILLEYTVKSFAHLECGEIYSYVSCFHGDGHYNVYTATYIFRTAQLKG